jgi:2-hydroxy-3-keto-5-methylthiopentenyl-1-phosphate phosphatase
MNTLDKKISLFKAIYNKNKNKLLYITDFDYTITRKYNYLTNEKFRNTYSIYNQEVFGGNQSLYLLKDKELAELYEKYEENNSYDYDIRKKKLYEWYKLSLINMSHEKLNKESFKKMVELNFDYIKMRNKFKILFELLIKEDIPIIIISGGIKEIIIEILKTLNIKEFNNYLSKKKVIIIANSLLEKDKQEMIYPFNKNLIIKKILDKNYKGFESIIIVGDLITDYQSINELDIDKEKNVIGIGFLDYEPKKMNIVKNNYKNDIIFKEYFNVFDIVLLNDQGYDYIIDILQKIISKY